MVENGRERLGRLMAEARRRLRLSVRAAAQLAGIDRQTWTSAENGTRLIATYNRAGVERALRWEPGSVDLVLEGGDPATVPDQRPAAAEQSLEAEVARIRALPLPPGDRLIMLRALIELYAEVAEESERPSGRAS